MRELGLQLIIRHYGHRCHKRSACSSPYEVHWVELGSSRLRVHQIFDLPASVDAGANLPSKDEVADLAPKAISCTFLELLPEMPASVSHSRQIVDEVSES